MAPTFSAANAVVKTAIPEFIPELWSDEILAVYKANYVMPQLVTTMDFSGRKGDTLHIPKPVRGSASAKVAANAVTLIQGASSEFVLTIDQHWEYSRLIEDIVSIQALDSLRAFYTDDAGYSLATVVDTQLHSTASFGNAAGLSGGGDPLAPASSAYDGAVIGGDGATKYDPTGAGNQTTLTDAGIRRAIRTMDDLNVPSRMRAWVIPPVEKENLLGIERFTQEAFVGEAGPNNTIRNGVVGNLYGIPVYVSTNVATDTAPSNDARQVLLIQREGVLHAEQLAPRTQTQYKQEFLADLLTSDILFGQGLMRPECVLPVMVPA